MSVYSLLPTVGIVLMIGASLLGVPADRNPVLAGDRGPATQDPIWTFETGGPIYGSPAVHEKTVFIGSSDGHIYAVDSETGSERWRFRTGGAVDARPAVAGRLVFAPSRDGRLYAIDANEGMQQWSFQTAGEQRHDFWDFYLSDPLIRGELVVFGSGDGHVYALDRATGVERWRLATGAPVHGAPVADDQHVYVGGFDGVVYAIRPETGEPVWTYRVEGNTYFPQGELQRGPVLHEGVLYVGSRDYHLYAIDASNGQLRWRLKEGNGWIIATPLVVGEHLYFGASDGQRFYSAERSSGAIRWSTAVQTRVFGSAISVGDLVVFGGFNGKLLALDPAVGTLRWSFQTPASRARFATVYGPDGSMNEEMRELYRTGRGFEAEERFLSLGSIPGTPTFAEGRIYFGSTEGVLYALDVQAIANVASGDGW